MRLADLLSISQILPDLRGDDQWGAIEEMVEHLDGLDRLCGEKKTEVLELLRERESKISTGIGSGVAIPHAFCEELEDVICLFGRSREGVDFQALDHAPVHFIVLFLVPQSQYAAHLQTLAAIARMFKNCETRRQLVEAESREEILAILEATSGNQVPRKKVAKS